VDYVAGKWRVNGRLAVTRSFGDETLKPIVIAEPEVKVYSLEGNEALLMLSCDGLFDVLDNVDIASFLDRQMKMNIPLSQITTALVQEGVAKGSHDDITGESCTNVKSICFVGCNGYIEVTQIDKVLIKFLIVSTNVA
jgi:protein phosphatase 1L